MFTSATPREISAANWKNSYFAQYITVQLVICTQIIWPMRLPYIWGTMICICPHTFISIILCCHKPWVLVAQNLKCTVFGVSDFKVSPYKTLSYRRYWTSFLTTFPSVRKSYFPLKFNQQNNTYKIVLISQTDLGYDCLTLVAADVCKFGIQNTLECRKLYIL